MTSFGPQRGVEGGIRRYLPDPNAKRFDMGGASGMDIAPGLGAQVGPSGSTDVARGISRGLGNIQPSGGDVRTGLYVTSKVRSDAIEHLVPEGSVFAVGMPVFRVNVPDDERSCILTLPVLNTLLRKGHELWLKDIKTLDTQIKNGIATQLPLENLIGSESKKRPTVLIGPEFFKTIRSVDDLMEAVAFIGIYKASSATHFRGTGLISEHEIYGLNTTLTIETQGHIEFMFNFGSARVGESVFLVPYRDHQHPGELSLDDGDLNYGPLQFKMIATRLPRPSFLSNGAMMAGAAMRFDGREGREIRSAHDMVWTMKDSHGVAHQHLCDWYETSVPPHMTKDTCVRELIVERNGNNLLCYEVPVSPPVYHIGKVLHENMTYGPPLSSQTAREALVDPTAQVIRAAENSIMLFMNVYLT